MQADLTQWARLLDKPSPQVRAFVQRTLGAWERDSKLASVRGEPIARLPEAEQQAWRKLWTDVETTLAGVREGKSDPRDTPVPDANK